MPTALRGHVRSQYMPTQSRGHGTRINDFRAIIDARILTVPFLPRTSRRETRFLLRSTGIDAFWFCRHGRECPCHRGYKTDRERNRHLGMARMDCRGISGSGRLPVRECREGASSYASSQCLFARGCVFRVGEVGDLACQIGTRESKGSISRDSSVGDESERIFKKGRFILRSAHGRGRPRRRGIKTGRARSASDIVVRPAPVPRAETASWHG